MPPEAGPQAAPRDRAQADPVDRSEGAPAAPPEDLLDRKLLFVTGKGGVGKTTVASSLAFLAAERGKRTLLCEIDAKGALSDALETGHTGFKPAEVHPRLWAMSMDTEASLREYLRLNLRVPVAGRIGPVARAFEFVATAAPGVREILVVGKLCYEVRERHWDLVVVDASPTGNVVGQLAAPQAINDLVSIGPIRQQTGWIVEILSDPELTGVCIVTTPEEMPVNETIELTRRVRQETSVSLAAIVVNRVLPELFGRGEEKVFEALIEPDRAAMLAKAVDGDVQPVLDGAALAVTVRRTGAAHLERLRAEVDPAVPMLYVPYQFARSHGLRSTRNVAGALSAELGY